MAFLVGFLHGIFDVSFGQILKHCVARSTYSKSSKILTSGQAGPFHTSTSVGVLRERLKPPGVFWRFCACLLGFFVAQLFGVWMSCWVFVVKIHLRGTKRCREGGNGAVNGQAV